MRQRKMHSLVLLNIPFKTPISYCVAFCKNCKSCYPKQKMCSNCCNYKWYEKKRAKSYDFFYLRLSFNKFVLHKCCLHILTFVNNCQFHCSTSANVTKQVCWLQTIKVNPQKMIRKESNGVTWHWVYTKKIATWLR